MFWELGRLDTEREGRDPLYPCKGTSEMNDTKDDGALCCRHEEVHFNTTFRDFEIYQEIRNNRVASAVAVDDMHDLDVDFGPCWACRKVGSETGSHTNGFSHNAARKADVYGFASLLTSSSPGIKHGIPEVSPTDL